MKEAKEDLNLLEHADRIRQTWPRKRIRIEGIWFRMEKHTVGNVDYISILPEDTSKFTPCANLPLSWRQYEDEMSRRGTPEAERKPRHGK